MSQKIYLDACCLNRPFDDQRQLRIRIESESILEILEKIKKKEIIWCSSDILEFELENINDLTKRAKISSLLRYAEEKIELTDEIQSKAVEIEKLGFKSLDSLHIASAVIQKVGVMLTTDDKLERNGKKNYKKLGTRILNPLEWIKNIM